MTTQSKIGINAVNFFLAEVGIILPFLANFLKEEGWNYNQIGIALAFGAVGGFLFQIIAGMISDRVRNQKNLLALSSIAFGITYYLVTQFPQKIVLITFLIFLTGLWGTFFIPLLGSLALSLAQKGQYEKLLGINRSWYHIGNLAVAGISIFLIDHYGVSSIFILVAGVSFFAALVTLLISKEDLSVQKKEKSFTLSDLFEVLKDTKKVLKNKTVITLFIFVTIFSSINATLMPMVGLYLNKIENNANQLVSIIVIITQAFMVLVAWLAGKHSEYYGRKFLLGIAFFSIPLRALLCSFITNSYGLVAVQILDSITAGLYGVVTCLICSDLSNGKKGFSTLLGMVQTALALGGIIGPLIQGYLTTTYGFKTTFFIFSLITFFAFIFFLIKMPETRQNNLDDLKASRFSLFKNRLKAIVE